MKEKREWCSLSLASTSSPLPLLLCSSLFSEQESRGGDFFSSPPLPSLSFFVSLPRCSIRTSPSSSRPRMCTGVRGRKRFPLVSSSFPLRARVCLSGSRESCLRLLHDRKNFRHDEKYVPSLYHNMSFLSLHLPSSPSLLPCSLSFLLFFHRA